MRARQIALLAVAVASCAETITQAADLSIAPDSRVDHVVFVLTGSELFYGLTVFPCGSERAVWVLGREGSNAGAPSRIVYGEAPAGYVTRSPAQPLRPGCYRVVVSGPAVLQFTVNADGSVASPQVRHDTTHAR